MKKNFLMVAAMLIAAMLMVVSCTQEVAPKNNGLVEAKLNVAYGRDLSVTGDTKQYGVSLTYKMWPSWTATGSEVIYGGTLNTEKTDYEFKELHENGNLGYVTPGLWNIEVRASGNNVTNNVNGPAKTIFSGTASVYFNETTKEATVYLAPVSEGTNNVTFSFFMQDLSTNMSSDYFLEYKIYSGIDNSRSVRSGELSGTTVEAPENVKIYKEKDSIEPLPGGFYRVNVSIYRKKSSPAQNELVGGTTKGFLVSGGATVTIGGNIEPSDYESVSIDAYYVDVNTAFKTGTFMDGETQKEYGKSLNNTADGGATVKMGIDDTTNHNSTITGSYTKTYLWTAVSDGKTMSRQISNAPSDVEFEFNSPGYKNISCTTVYSITGTSTGGTSDTYYFADTISTQVYVDPSNFKVKPTTSTNE